MKVLVLDDEAKVCKKMKNILAELGHNAVVTERPCIALSLLRTGVFDVILLDILMDEMNGVDVVQEIKDMGSDVKIIVLTSIDDEGIQKYIKNLGIDKYIIKPYDMDSIRNTIDETMLALR